MFFLEAPLILAVIGYTFYKILELYYSRPLKNKIIDKIETIRLNGDDMNIKFPSFNSSSVFSSLRLSLLLIGLSLGAFLGNFLNAIIPQIYNVDIDSSICISCVGFFGGVGLLISYILERKQLEKDKVEKEKLLANKKYPYPIKEEILYVTNEDKLSYDEKNQSKDGDIS